MKFGGEDLCDPLEIRVQVCGSGVSEGCPGFSAAKLEMRLEDWNCRSRGGDVQLAYLLPWLHHTYIFTYHLDCLLDEYSE